MKRIITTVAILWLAVIWLMAGCLLRGGSSAARPLALVVSGDTGGWIVPCGCASNQSGGLLRRGSYLKHLAGDHDVLYVDAGGASSGTPRYDQLKFLAILRGEVAMGIQAHNLGAGELALGAETLRRAASQTGVPFISANVRTGDGVRLVEPYRIVRAGGQRVLLIGVVSPQYATNGLTVGDPRREILDVLDETSGQRDLTVVLAYLPESPLRELAEQLPEVDFVIGGPTGQAMAPQQVGPTTLAAATNKGRFLIEFTWSSTETPRGQAPAGRVIEMDEIWTDDAAQHANLQAFYAVLEQDDVTPDQNSFAQYFSVGIPETYHIAGNDSCRSCHLQDCTIWDASRHAHAWETLKATGAHVDAYCQQCHTTGYGMPGGFVSIRQTPQLINVGCETCHGPSAAHARTPTVRTAFYQQAANRCVQCHDRENSPNFDYDVYWPRILHGFDTEQTTHE